MINNELDLQPWKPRTRVFNYRRIGADKKEKRVTEFILDQSAGIANQAIIKMATSNKFDVEKLSDENRKLVNKIYQYIEVFEANKGRKPHFIWLTYDQIRRIKSDCKKAGMPPPKNFRGVMYTHYLGAV
ncbi:hypothetical protein H0A36_25850 [Endozoicomonas sp. SM1973]|uniref:Uncharacterized protein n=1 Tax=Spartinivicinus marinus TaxID=2994442 RepID=A0A853IHD3_9GAMM|nr:hypothetical protein [Spartinivicinus marinus]MCX4027895.1 hypothetical protein [Spartinivicinus marinus]NYZ69444.1 hypothetical protein [Spartinivicinus marinus]